MTPRGRSSLAAPRRHRRPNITLDQLHTFLAVAEAEHVTAAADHLNLSQGTVSASIRRLEQTLGLPLFNRVGRNVGLTDVGRAVRQLSVRVLEGAAQIEDLTAGYLAFEAGELAIASGRVLGVHRLATWLAPFVGAHPDIAIRIVVESMANVAARLEDGRADVVFLGAPVRTHGIETVQIERTTLVFVVAAGHPLATSTDPMKALRAHRQLAHESDTATQAAASRLIKRMGEGGPTIELEEAALVAALLAGIGYAVMPRTVVEQEIADGRLVVLPHGGAPVAQVFVAARRVSLHTPAVQALWGYIQDMAASGRPESAPVRPRRAPTR